MDIILNFTRIKFTNDIITTVGLFSISGGLTNWLAIHMLFERFLFFMV